jgi:hypothetical protein
MVFEQVRDGGRLPHAEEASDDGDRDCAQRHKLNLGPGRRASVHARFRWKGMIIFHDSDVVASSYGQVVIGP